MENDSRNRDYCFIEDDDSLTKLIESHLCNIDTIAIDSEFLRFDRESPPKLALLQFKTKTVKGAIDPLRCRNVGDFISYLFKNKSIVKILHDAKQDLETFEFFVNFEISKDEIFDTQIAELFINYYTNGTPSYKELVQKYCGKSISKYYQNSNWLKRPLIDKQISYAVTDVEFLHDIHCAQIKSLQKLNRVDIYCDYLIKRLNNHIHKIKTSKNVDFFVEKERVDEIYKNLCNACESANITPSVIATKNDIRHIITFPTEYPIEEWKLKFLKF